MLILSSILFWVSSTCSSACLLLFALFSLKSSFFFCKSLKPRVSPLFCKQPQICVVKGELCSVLNEVGTGLVLAV